MIWFHFQRILTNDCKLPIHIRFSRSALKLKNIFIFSTDKTDFVKAKPGIRFTEKMVGKFTPSNSETEVPCEFTLTIESDDVERMINCDLDHAAKMSGTVTCLALSSSPMSVSEGKLVKMCTILARLHYKNWNKQTYLALQQRVPLQKILKIIEPKKWEKPFASWLLCSIN